MVVVRIKWENVYLKGLEEFLTLSFFNFKSTLSLMWFPILRVTNKVKGKTLFRKEQGHDVDSYESSCFLHHFSHNSLLILLINSTYNIDILHVFLKFGNCWNSASVTAWGCWIINIFLWIPIHGICNHLFVIIESGKSISIFTLLVLYI